MQSLVYHNSYCPSQFGSTIVIYTIGYRTPLAFSLVAIIFTVWGKLYTLPFCSQQPKCITQLVHIVLDVTVIFEQSQNRNSLHRSNSEPHCILVTTQSQPHSSSGVTGHGQNDPIWKPGRSAWALSWFCPNVVNKRTNRRWSLENCQTLGRSWRLVHIETATNIPYDFHDLSHILVKNQLAAEGRAKEQVIPTIYISGIPTHRNLVLYLPQYPLVLSLGVL
jgi:hypothetical protein